MPNGYMQTRINKYDSDNLEFSGMKHCSKHNVWYSYHCIECEEEKNGRS